MPDWFKQLQAEIEMLEVKWTEIEDRVQKLEQYASNDHNRITSLEDWQEEVTDTLDQD